MVTSERAAGTQESAIALGRTVSVALPVSRFPRQNYSRPLFCPHELPTHCLVTTRTFLLKTDQVIGAAWVGGGRVYCLFVSVS